MDLWLTGASAILQLVLGGMGIYVALRPPKPDHHMQWISAFALVGVCGVALTVGLTSLADVAQKGTQDKLDLIR